jgi:XisH protein
MAKDLYHDAVRLALENDGWSITEDPLSFKVGDISFRIDLAAEKILLANKDETKIAIEIKTFIQQSHLHAFYEAIGQYDNYLFALEDFSPERVLYLAIPLDVYQDFFQKPFIQKVVFRKKIKLLVYDPLNTTFLLWKP